MVNIDQEKLDEVDVKVLSALNHCFYTINTLSETLKVSKIKVRISLEKLLEMGYIQREEKQDPKTKKNVVFYFFPGNADLNDKLSGKSRNDYLLSLIANSIREHSPDAQLFHTSVFLTEEEVVKVQQILMKARNAITERSQQSENRKYQVILFMDKAQE